MTMDIECRCDKCGGNLEVELAIKEHYRTDAWLIVKPCKDCMDEAKKEAHDEGFEEGQQNIIDSQGGQ